MARLLGVGIGARLVDRLADDVDDAPERAVADGHGDRLAGVGHLLAAHQAFGGVHGHRAHGVLAQVLRHLEHQAAAAVLGLERIEDRRQMPVELHVDDGAHHLADTTDYVGCHGSFLVLRSRQWSDLAVFAGLRPSA